MSVKDASPFSTATRPPGRWSRWLRFLNQREAGSALALFRIACGLGVLGAVGTVALHGLAPVIWLDQANGGYRDFPPPEETPWLFQLLGGLGPVAVWSMIAVALVSGLLLLLGLGGRLPALFALQAYLALADINPRTGGSDDLMLANSLWLLVLARSTATLSLDCRLRTGRWVSSALVPAWPRYLAIYQLVLTYWATGMQKVGINWTPGGDCSALYYILQIPSWQRWDMTWLAWVFPLTQLATAVTWFFEGGAPLLLLAFWYRNTRERPGRLRAFFNWLSFRRLFVLVGLGMHVSIFVLMNVEPFNWVTLSYYVCLFRPEEWHGLWQRLGGARGQEAVDGVPAAGALAQVRGVLVGLHLVAITLLAFPAPGPQSMHRDAWNSPDAQEELAGWSKRLEQVGIAVTREELEERLCNIATAYQDAHQKATAPFQPYYDYLGTYQSWRMFAAPTRHPTRLHIEVHESGLWRPVYVERDAKHDWLGAWLDHSRLRPVLFRFGLHEGEEFAGFAAWVARHAARHFPQADQVRVRYLEHDTLPAAEVRHGRRPSGQFRAAVVLRLEEFR